MNNHRTLGFQQFYGPLPFSEVIKLFHSSAQLMMKFILFLNFEILGSKNLNLFQLKRDEHEAYPANKY